MEAEILQCLRHIRLPKDNRRGVRKDASDPKQGMCLGIVDHYFQSCYTCSLNTRKFPELTRLLCRYAREKRPDFKFCCIQVNRGSSALHVDTYDQGKQLIMSLGDHVGGCLYQYPRQLLDIRGHLEECCGLLPHMTLPFEGERFSIVYFCINPRKIRPPSLDQQQFLDECGFYPLPAERRLETPRVDLLPEAARILEDEFGVAKEEIGDWTNKSISSRRPARRLARRSTPQPEIP
jgi:hypothetical protein